MMPTDARNASPRDLDPGTRERQNVIWSLRALFLILSVVVLSLGIVTGSAQNALGIELVRWWWLGVGATLVLFVVVVALDVLTPRRKLSTISAIIFGSFMGLLATLVLGFVIDVFTKTYDLDTAFAQPILTAKVLLGLGMCYLGITTVLQTQDDFRLAIPYVEFSKQYRGARPLLLDSSALIDGRIAELAGTGLFTTPIVIPRFVVDELQLLSDSHDAERRRRGRRGLEVVARLRRAQGLDVSVDESPVAGANPDQKLVELGAALAATIVTTDWALARVAAIKDVHVLNINELARALRPGAHTGDEMTIRLVRKGEQDAQGIGYLDDGTMVVVQDAEHRIGEHVRVDITGTTHTSAGRLVFASLADDAPVTQPEPLPEPDTPPAPRPTHAPPSPAPSSRARNPRRRRGA